MKRLFGFTFIILAFASAGAADAPPAQSRRVWRVEPPRPERTEKSEPDDAKKDEAADESRADEAKDRAQNEARAGDDQPLTLKEVTVRAVIRSKSPPVYPREARPYGVEGEVKLRIILGADGKVRDEVDVLEGLPHGLTEEAIRAARRIKFEPARKDGRPVSQYVIVIYSFRLH
ncbi:MAG TPA: energy transducer TonB [Pyrinomonadaceae bacterium]|nr:energy transducer TonB [Pyrinomonadaceae bacterium]